MLQVPILLLLLIYIYVAVSRFYVVCSLIIICLYFLFYNYSTYFLIFLSVFLFCMFLFYFVYSVFLYFLCIVSPFVYNCFLPIFAQVYRPLPPGGNPVAVNKHHIISYIIAYHTTTITITLDLWDLRKYSMSKMSDIAPQQSHRNQVRYLLIYTRGCW